MAELTPLMHDGSDDGFHEIQLSGKQLVFLFMATTVVSVVIFLCGVLVGRGVRAEREGEPADPTVAEVPVATDTLSDAGPQATEPPVPAEDGEPPLTGKDRVESDKAAQEDLKAEAERPRAAEAPAGTTDRADDRPERSARPAEPPPAPAETPTRRSEAAARPPAGVPRTTEVAASKAAERTSGATARSPRVAAPGARNTWVVQIVALRDRGAASSIVQRLSGKGYPAFVVNPAGGAAAPVFKVQVGRYADRNDAEQVARRLEREEQFKPWVSR